MTEDDKALCERAEAWSDQDWKYGLDGRAETFDALKARIEALSAEVERLNETVRRVQASARALSSTQAEIYGYYVKNSGLNHEAISTLDSEREANARLTDELAASEARAARLEEALREIMILPGEVNMGNYTDDDVHVLNNSHIEAYQIAHNALGEGEA